MKNKKECRTDKNTMFKGTTADSYKIIQIVEKLKNEYKFITSSDSALSLELLHNYKNLCESITAALQFSKEKETLDYEFGYFNNEFTIPKALIVKYNGNVYYFYPMSIVIQDLYTIQRKVYEEFTISLVPTHWSKSFKNKILNLDSMSIHVNNIDAANNVINSFKIVLVTIGELNKHKQESVIKALPIENREKAQSIIYIKKSTIDGGLEPVDKKKEEFLLNSNTPQTLEDCFCDIIHNHGYTILKDKYLAYIIESQYSVIGIEEYKKIIVKMIDNDFLLQFVDLKKQNDFVVYNSTNSFARKQKLNVQTCMFIIQALIAAIKRNQ